LYRFLAIAVLLDVKDIPQLGPLQWGWITAAKKEREEKQKELDENIRFHAQYHATAVAAIVLSGESKIDEPLSRAWTRALQHYGIRDVNAGTRLKRQVGAAQQLAPIILPITPKDAEASARLSEIFMPAPVWLLNFTCIFFNACWLKFDFPNRSWPVLGTKWGRAGYEESLLWPLLPLGAMTDGEPLSDKDARRWPFPLENAFRISHYREKNSLTR